MENGEKSVCGSFLEFAPEDFGRWFCELFLSLASAKKNHVRRLFSWMVMLDIIPGSRVNAAVLLQHICEVYAERIGSDDPVAKLSAREIKTIDVDILRSVKWFLGAARAQGLAEEYTSDAGERAKRVLALLSLLNSDLSYLQGFDRYVFLTLFLGLEFTSKYGLSSDVAEAFSYHLSEKLLHMAKPYMLTEKSPIEHFEELDRFLETSSPDKFHVIKEANLSSMTFALRWEMLLFCDEHDLDDTLLIWDNIILNRNHFKDYLDNICLEHFKQVEFANQCAPLESLQKFKKWDVNKIIMNANSSIELVKAKKWKKGKYILYFIICTSILVLIFAYFEDKTKFIQKQTLLKDK